MDYDLASRRKMVRVGSTDLVAKKWTNYYFWRYSLLPNRVLLIRVTVPAKSYLFLASIAVRIDS